jgi:peptidoglycan/LPS O-acetylase OafA/YrhL
VIDRGHSAEPKTVSPAVAPPPGSPRFALFDSLRAIAVLAVLLFHVATLTGEGNKHVVGDVLGLLGNQGLVIFFVISGFLLYRPYAAAHADGRPRPDTRRYARRRVLRIVPAYWTALTLLAIYPGITGVFSHEWWRYYLFLQVYAQRTQLSGIPVAWTLAVEVSFYVLLPAWAALVRGMARRSRGRSWVVAEWTPLALLAAVGIAVQLAKSRLATSTLLPATLLGECVWFAIGMALAVASVDSERNAEPSRLARAVAARPGWCWLGSIACLLAAAPVIHPRGLNLLLAQHTVQPFAKTIAAMALTGAVAFLLVLPAVFGEGAGGWPRRVLAWRPLMLLGLVSYGVYLYHLTVAEWLALPSGNGYFSSSGPNLVAHIHHLTTPVVLLATLVIAIALASVSYRFVELPFLRRKEAGR